MKTILMRVVAVFFIVIVLFSAKLAWAESCSGGGQKQYRPQGTCATGERTCCDMLNTWSEWNDVCPSCDCSPSATRACSAGNGTEKCATSCRWENCMCNAGYHMSGSNCVKDIDCSDASYKLSHKSECCPKVSLSDSVCYTQDKYGYRSQGSVSADVNTSCSGSALNDRGSDDDKCTYYLRPIRYSYTNVSKLSAAGCASDSCNCTKAMEGSFGYTKCSSFGFSGTLSGGVCWGFLDLYKCIQTVVGGQRLGW